MLTVTDTTLSGNSAGCCGGGIGNFNGATVNLGATILANNTGGDCSGTFNNLGYNLDDDGTCDLTATGDVSDTPPDLIPPDCRTTAGPPRPSPWRRAAPPSGP